jgi:hypothetical protein
MKPNTNPDGKKRKSFFSTDFAKISITAIITTGILWGCQESMHKDYEDQAEISFVSNSQRISWSCAKNMIVYWKEHPLLKVADIDDNNKKKPLRAFRFNADQIRDIVDTKPNVEKPDEVVICIGRTPDITVNGKHVKQIHLIVLGMKGGKLLNESVSGLEPRIYDKADPCPPGKNCPPLPDN